MIDENTQAILLLTTNFSHQLKDDPAPLTPTEYGRFAKWLHENKFQPKDLMRQLDQVCALWTDPKSKITDERLRYLFGRGMALSIAVEKWQSAGIWIMVRSDPDYPKSLRTKLGTVSPAVIFGVGNKALVNAGGLALVGSRNVDAADTDFSATVARTAANIGLNVVSGGAKGVDETAMLAALEAEGTSLGVLANGLLQAATSGKWRSYLKNRQLCLISVYYPEAPFHVGNAMGRNKYIYCLADQALVVRSEQGRGGTWAGAIENINKRFVPLLVKGKSDATGNMALIAQGAIALDTPPAGQAELEKWLSNALQQVQATDAPERQTFFTGPQKPEPAQDNSTVTLRQNPPPQYMTPTISTDSKDAFYNFFLQNLDSLLSANRSLTLKSLHERHPDVLQSQLKEWLQRAVSEGKIIRPGQALSYTLPVDRESVARQGSLFGEEKDL